MLCQIFSYCFLTAPVSCDNCDGVTCHNGGTCEVRPADFWCEYSKGWTGRHCSLNGGTNSCITMCNGQAISNYFNAIRNIPKRHIW